MSPSNWPPPGARLPAHALATVLTESETTDSSTPLLTSSAAEQTEGQATEGSTAFAHFCTPSTRAGAGRHHHNENLDLPSCPWSSGCMLCRGTPLHRTARDFRYFPHHIELLHTEIAECRVTRHLSCKRSREEGVQ